MNQEPHTHGVKIERDDSFPHFGHWVVKYGDTKVHFARFWAKPYKWPLEKQNRVIDKALAKAVKRHDHGSMRLEPAGWRHESAVNVIKRLFPDKVGEGHWAIEAMKEPVSG